MGGMKTLYFISGLPRSGSTLLCNILAQNPRFQVAGTSGLVDMLLLVRNSWDQLQEFRAMPAVESEEAKVRVLRGMLNSYYPRGSEVAFDKSRTWLAHIEMVECLLGGKVKVLVPVRDIRDILASLEMLWRRVGTTRQIPYEAGFYFPFQSAQGRCNTWMAENGMVGIAYARVRDSLVRGFADRLHFVEYESLTNCPGVKMRAIYNFLEERYFEHQFDNVESVTREDDLAYGFPGLHESRRKVEPNPSKWEAVLGDVAGKYGALNAWIGIGIKEN